MIRLYAAEAREGRYELTPQQHHYLFHVVRWRPGEPVSVLNGRGAAFDATVDPSDGPHGCLQLRVSQEVRPPPMLTLVQAIPKADKFEWVLQKATELGVSEIWPVYSDHAVVKPSARDAQKVERWQRICDEAARQCGRTWGVRVQPSMGVLEAGRSLSGPGLHRLVVLDERSPRPFRSAFAPSNAASQAVALFVGPEGSFSEAERAALATFHAHFVHLGPAILRTETAAIAAVALARHLDGTLEHAPV